MAMDRSCRVRIQKEGSNAGKPFRDQIHNIMISGRVGLNSGGLAGCYRVPQLLSKLITLPYCVL